jgi:hypothetical protein
MAAAAFRPFVSLVVIHGDGVPQRIDATIRHLGLCFLVALAMLSAALTVGLTE